MKRIQLLASILMLLVCCSVSTSPVLSQQEPETTHIREKHDTSDFVKVKLRVDELLEKYAADEVLLVVDIDNTLLAMNQDLGSDQWFNWQSGLLDDSPESADLVASDFGGLLSVQGTLFALSGMHPPEPQLPEMVKSIQSKGVATIVLTSRGPEFRDASERELKRNSYQFDSAENEVEIVEKRGTFKPFDTARPDRHGLSEQIVAEVLKQPRSVSYANGIYMTAGQHKGYMLKALLARAVVSAEQPTELRSFKAIVFVDDHDKHTNRMHDAYEHDLVDLVTYHYMQEDGNVHNFESSSKRHVIRDWNRLKDFIDAVLVK